jgi:SAM-dependent methyltransferase
MSRDRVSAHWGDADFTARLAEIHWMASPVVRAHLNRLASGDPRVDWLTWAWKRFVRGRRLRVLVLGCGGGWLERSIAHRPEIASIDACDVAAEAVAQAAEAARAAGLAHLRYHVVDLNEEPIPEPAGGGRYDLVIAHSVLHHVAALGHAFREIRARLRPGGLLLVNEYVGPARFQFGERQMAAIDDAFAGWPERLRRSALGGGVIARKEKPSRAAVIETDPSEAVRSNELLAFLRHHFRVVREVDYGGTVLQHLLFEVVQNFDPGDPGDGRLLAAACFFEAALIHEGLLPSDFALVVARNAARGERERAGRKLRRPPRAPRADEVPGAGVSAPAAPVPRIAVHTRPARERRHGLELPPVRAYLHRLATGDASCDWTSWLLHHRRAELAAPAGRTLVLGADDGWLAGRLRSEAWLGEVDCALPEGESESEDSLPEGAYGRVFTDGWLGRVGDRRGLADRLAARLAPGGWLIGDDYLGRPDGRPSAAALAYARELGELFQPPAAAPPSPRERRRARLVALANRLALRLSPPPPAGPAAALAALLGDRFDLVLVRPTGGALLQRALAAVGDRFAAADGRDEALLALCCRLEERLTEAGVLADEYACWLARLRR